MKRYTIRIKTVGDSFEISESSYKEIIKFTNIASTFDKWIKVPTVIEGQWIEFWITQIAYLKVNEFPDNAKN